jgi:hypothetical protein
MTEIQLAAKIALLSCKTWEELADLMPKIFAQQAEHESSAMTIDEKLQQLRLSVKTLEAQKETLARKKDSEMLGETAPEAGDRITRKQLEGFIKGESYEKGKPFTIKTICEYFSSPRSPTSSMLNLIWNGNNVASPWPWFKSHYRVEKGGDRGTMNIYIPDTYKKPEQHVSARVAAMGTATGYAMKVGNDQNEQD